MNEVLPDVPHATCTKLNPGKPVGPYTNAPCCVKPSKSSVIVNGTPPVVIVPSILYVTVVSVVLTTVLVNVGTKLQISVYSTGSHWAYTSGARKKALVPHPDPGISDPVNN